MSLLRKTLALLCDAVDCDNVGRKFEALALYEKSIPMLMDLAKMERNHVTGNYYYRCVRDYIDRCEYIKICVKKELSQSEHVASILVPENSENNGYEVVFGKYLNENVRELLLEEPHFEEKAHFQNLTAFLELVVQNCPRLSYVRITTKPSPGDRHYQTVAFEEFKDEMQSRNITLNYVIDDVKIEPKIILSNGFTIKLDKGLHYFQPLAAFFNLGLCNLNLRKCHECHINIFAIGP